MIPSNEINLTNSQKYYANLSETKVSEIQTNLWTQIRELEDNYNTKSMSEFSGENNFSDLIWKIDDVCYIKWSKLITPSESNLPLLLLLKITLYHYIQVLKQDGAGICYYISIFIKIFAKRMSAENILFADNKGLFIPASIINEEKISLWIKDSVSTGELFSPGALTILVKISSIPISKFYGVNFLKIKTSFPWKNYKSLNGLSKLQLYLNDILGTKATRTEIKSYKAFSENSIAKLLDFSIPIITEYAMSFKDVFDIASDKRYRQKENPNLLTTIGRDKILTYQVILEKVLPIKLHGDNELRISYINELYDIVLAASLWIILLSTGLRNVDVRLNLLKKCFIPDQDSKLIFYLITDIKKTKQKNYPIPVPLNTIDAINFLNSINISPNDCPYLIVRRSLTYASTTANTWHYASGSQLNNLLRKMSDLIEVDLLDGLEENDNSEGVAHRCRATMAGWIGTNSPLAVLIIRRLYGHTNGVMPDHYLKHNVHVQAERKEIQRQTYISTSEEFAENIITGNISGGVSESLKAGAKNVENLIILEAQQNNESLTQGEIRETLKTRIADVLFKRLSQGVMLGLQTPLAYICMRNPISAVDAPCAINSSKQEKIDKEIDKHFASSIQMTGLPELGNCKGPLCQHSFLYDNPLTKILLEQFKYYVTYLKGISKTKINLDLEAKNFIKLYSAPLTEVYPDIMNKLSNRSVKEK